MAKRRPVPQNTTEGRPETWGTAPVRPPRPPAPGTAEAIAARPAPHGLDYGEVRAQEDRVRDTVMRDVAAYREPRQRLLHTESLEPLPRGKAKIRMDGDASQPRPDRGPGGAVSD